LSDGTQKCHESFTSILNEIFDCRSDAGVHHIGSVAQDFQAMVGLAGNDDKHILVVAEGAWRSPPFKG